MPIPAGQLEDLRRRFGTAACADLPSGTSVVTISDYVLPVGWSKERVTIRFLVPAAYPFAALDCFWTDEDLRLANGAVPQNTGANPMPEVGGGLLWFSWHLQVPWNPGQHTLSTWMGVVGDRFRRPQ